MLAHALKHFAVAVVLLFHNHEPHRMERPRRERTETYHEYVLNSETL